ncbi:MAG: 4-hydroxy-tetrahydrodipicolinate reductase [Methanohalobium sp.]|uniref:4-hydroxy-tetrahydrodipicolinate reductase n=1 Tax=Methanohalobium sp. TaxID=2837493 RepID=UPI003979C546
MTRAAVSGAYGRMGKMLIDNIANSNNFELSAAFDIFNIGNDAGESSGVGTVDVPISDPENMGDVLAETNTEVLIDFTAPNATVQNVIAASERGVNLVIGTTGFTEDQRNSIEQFIKKNNVSAVIAPNYSVGVNVFFKMIKEMSRYLSDYDIEILEAHHNNKKDAPSGTALKAADVIIETLGGKKYVYGRQGHAPRGDEIGIHAIRGGDIVGEHTVIFAGEGERMELKHQAGSRQAFAGGAIKAAQWVSGAKPGIYTMEDVLGF